MGENDKNGDSPKQYKLTAEGAHYQIMGYAPSVTVSKVAEALAEVSASPLNEKLIDEIAAILKTQKDAVLAILADDPTPDLLRDLKIPEHHPKAIMSLAATERIDRRDRRGRDFQLGLAILSGVGGFIGGLVVGLLTK